MQIEEYNRSLKQMKEDRYITYKVIDDYLVYNGEAKHICISLFPTSNTNNEVMI
jgi:hypothetical protein